MQTLLDVRLARLRQRIQQKLPQASESVLEQVWSILTATDNNAELSELASEEEELYAEFERWEAASDGKQLAMKTKLKSRTW